MQRNTNMWRTRHMGVWQRTDASRETQQPGLPVTLGGFETKAGTMQLRKALMMSAAVVSLTMSTTAAQAADSYVSLFGGASFLQKSSLKGGASTHTTTVYRSSTQSLDTSFKTGFVVGGNLGVDWGTFRTEIELAYRDNMSSSSGHLKQSYRTEVHYSGQVYPNYYSRNTDFDGTVPTNLRTRAYSLMANVWYDFHGLELPAGITPYVGGGIGGANVQISGSANGRRLIDSNNFVFAWQLGAGVSVPLTDTLKAFLDYRYFSAEGGNFMLTPGFHSSDVKGGFQDHAALIGVRMSL
jgi:OmpA-OmpF porin, OOP family